MTRKALLLLMLANAMLSLASVAAYSRWVAPREMPRLAVLDVAELYRSKEAQIAALLAKREISDADRLVVLRQAGTFGGEVATLLQGLPEECRCLILARGAVAGPTQALPDLTPEVRRRLGLTVGTAP